MWHFSHDHHRYSMNGPPSSENSVLLLLSSCVRGHWGIV